MTVEARKTRKQIIEEKLAKRTPVSGFRLALAFDLPKGYVGRWVNDVGSGIEDMLAAEWEFVQNDGQSVSKTRDNSSVVRKRVDKSRSNAPVYAYLMAIEKEIYELDQKKKASDIAETVEGIKEGRASGFEGRIDGRTTYVKHAVL